MKISGRQILMVVILATVRHITSATVPDFEKALKIVENAKRQPGNINYGTFCNATGQGASKLGCQIKSMDDVGLLVCLKSEDCKFKLREELDGLKVIGGANLTVLQYYDKVIEGLKCGKSGSTDVNCSGFLVAWIPTNQGMIKSLRGSIFSGTIEILVDWVKEYQPDRPARLMTGDDLEKIRNFMIPTDGLDDGYKRICDLQGFFMKVGGFLIADPDGVQLNTTLTGTCYDKDVYPTTKKVIDGLAEMVAELIK